ncbi:hypothetical protein [Microbacterium ulmi]|uniref:Uncharacterized protein n=1 Tax=Microbacterium ulmi TaxID=179095 RepID=A0A7Y2M3P3_9MICO|nr:hypothetical protein [Microbacterium ulmi]NII70221.1 hypothetical protein [Microbacterium ulmi]NNH04518.1 hypothetical protein [Microbacterium ulmi]
MAEATRRGVVAVTAGVAFVLVGAGVGVVAGGVLGIRALPAVDTAEAASPWAARILLALGIAWMLIGMLAARTRLVRRPGAAAARASWLASTRPWRARESSLGLYRLDRWLLVCVPAGLLVATRAAETSFVSWTYLAIVLGAWLVFALALRLFIGRRSPWPVIAAVGGAIVLRCVVTLFVVSAGGPRGAWFAFWVDPAGRVAYSALALALFLWVFLAAGWALSAPIGLTRAIGAVVASAGAAVAVPAAVIALVGIDVVRVALHDQFGRFGVTSAAAIPDAAAWVAAIVGLALAAVGVALAMPRRVAAS